MSLHLANLSDRIRNEDISRLFRRFGQCSVRLKNGYGFVDYDSWTDAEKALRSLNGKKICGEPMRISWSKKHPKPLQRFVNSARSHDVQHGRSSDRGVNDVRLHSSRSQKDLSVRNKHPDDNGGTRKCTDLHKDTGSFNRNKMGVKPPYKQRREMLEECSQVVPNEVHYDRWDEQRDSRRSGNDLDCQIKSDRYEPDNDDEIGEERKDFTPKRLAGSPYRETSLVADKRVHHHDNIRKHRGCFKCGAAGHKLRDCPLEDACHRKNSYHSDSTLKNEDDTKARGRDLVGGQESRSVGRLQSSTWSSISAKRHDADRKPLTVETYRAKRSSPPILTEFRGKTSKVYSRKRQREKKDKIFEAHDDKKSRISSLSPELGTLPLIKAFPESSVRSRSRSPVSHFCSASSMSKSRSNRSRSRSIKSNSKSMPTSPNSALPISLHRSLSSSPDRSEQSMNVPCVDHAINHELKEIPESKNETSTSINYHELDVIPLSKVDEIPQSENVVLEEEECCRPESNQVFECKITKVPTECEHVSFSNEVQPLLLEQGDKDNTDVEIAAEKQREIEDLENGKTLEIVHSPEPDNKVDLKDSSKLDSHMNISEEEFGMVLKHYGLKHLKYNEQHLGIEDYFGSARMWPWEMIYYRRLKKGLISTENYARRVAQNNAFGITDKYVRSSSGWDELVDNKHS